MGWVWNLLIAGLPVALASRLLHGPEWLTFAAAAISLLPLARWIGAGTEHAAAKVGSSIGGLLNATFGNAAELIIAIFPSAAAWWIWSKPRSRAPSSATRS